MKNKVIITVLLGILSMSNSIAQSVVTNQLHLDKEKISNTCFTASKYYFKSFNRVGEKPNPTVEKAIEEYLVTINPPHEKNYYWFAKDWSYAVADEDDADFTLSGEYNYNSGIGTGEAVYKETTGTVRLPYFVTAKEHKADLDIFFTFEYKDGSPTRRDTISVHKKSTQTPGKSYYNVKKLELQLNDLANAKISDYKELVNAKEVQINFPKVKIKDKALKEEYATINKLLKAGDYETAGSIVKKVYDAKSSPELSQALGICYELVGNYPKAAELHKALPNFHVNVRMKKNMAILNQAEAMGYTPEFIEFE